MKRKAKVVFEVESAYSDRCFQVTVSTRRGHRFGFMVDDCSTPEEALAAAAERWGQGHPTLVAGYVVESASSLLDTARQEGGKGQTCPNKDDAEQPF